MLSLVVYLGDGFWTFLFSMIAGFVIGLILGLLLGFNEADFKTEEL
jgi:ABC-type nitrate/sulfonate/bicarbonate transport system permease component